MKARLRNWLVGLTLLAIQLAVFLPAYWDVGGSG